MIVRRQGRRFVLFRQHDHALVSADFALRLAELDRFHPSAVFAIAMHDVAWRPLDREVLWNEAEGRPYSFMDYPLGPKLPAYKAGIDRVAAEDPYAGCLCSMHYASFFEGDSNPEAIRFREEELTRQERLKAGMKPEERDGLERDLHLLRFCDNLSLFICLNEPGRNTFPWFREGLDYFGRRMLPLWEGTRRLRLSPTPFRQPFTVAIPYQIFNEAREPEEEGQLTIDVIS